MIELVVRRGLSTTWLRSGGNGGHICMLFGLRRGEAVRPGLVGRTIQKTSRFDMIGLPVSTVHALIMLKVVSCTLDRTIPRSS